MGAQANAVGITDDVTATLGNVKGPDPAVWGEEQTATSDSTVEVKGPDPDAWAHRLENPHLYCPHGDDYDAATDPDTVQPPNMPDEVAASPED